MPTEPTPDKPAGSNSVQNKHPKKMDHRDLIRSSFWVGQIFMLIATVMGVFLAAQSGLEQALTFDSITRMESNYYLRKSLQDELTDNAQQIYDLC